MSVFQKFSRIYNGAGVPGGIRTHDPLLRRQSPPFSPYVPFAYLFQNVSCNGDAVGCSRRVYEYRNFIFVFLKKVIGSFPQV